MFVIGNLHNYMMFLNFKGKKRPFLQAGSMWPGFCVEEMSHYVTNVTTCCLSYTRTPSPHHGKRCLLWQPSNYNIHQCLNSFTCTNWVVHHSNWSLYRPFTKLLSELPHKCPVTYTNNNKRMHDETTQVSLNLPIYYTTNDKKCGGQTRLVTLRREAFPKYQEKYV